MILVVHNHGWNGFELLALCQDGEEELFLLEQRQRRIQKIKQAWGASRLWADQFRVAYRESEERFASYLYWVHDDLLVGVVAMVDAQFANDTFEQLMLAEAQQFQTHENCNFWNYNKSYSQLQYHQIVSDWLSNTYIGLMINILYIENI